MTAASKPERRKLSFAALDEAVQDAENLQANGYDKAGNWDLAQVCFHITEWMRFPMDGFPKPPWFIAIMLWGMRKTFAKKMRAKYLVEGMPSGKPTMPQTIGQHGDPVAAIAKLKETVERFTKFSGPMHASPLFGAMSKDEATELQLLHCGHHLSFLVPKA